MLDILIDIQSIESECQLNLESLKMTTYKTKNKIVAPWFPNSKWYYSSAPI